MAADWLDAVHFNDEGLVPVVTQDKDSARVLMVAWMNRDALMKTVETGTAVYFSRSRNQLWQKGEQSGNGQQVSELQLDCDGDVLVLRVSQSGGIACHTGRESCFYRTLRDGAWVITEPVLKDPKEIYGSE